MPPSIATLIYIDATGYHFPDFATIQNWVTQNYQQIYGYDADTDPNTQDGQFIAFISQLIYDTASLGNAVYNSFSPSTAQGTGLARLVKINGLTKEVASYSTVVLTIIGTNGTVISNGSALDALGQQWNLPATVTIPSGGTISVTATAATIGFITANPSTVTVINTPTNGWQSVTNPSAATPGAPVETDSALRQRQAASTSLPAQTVTEATQGAILNVAGVTKALVYENYTNSTDSNSLPPHSICAVVVGGSTTDVATAIQKKKTPGTQPYGTTGPIVIYDSKGMPVNIYYTQATTAEIQVTVNLTPGANWSNDYIAMIQAAVAAYLNALPIGATVQYTQLFVAAYLVGNPAGLTYNITSITAGKNGGSQSSANILLAFNENPVCNPSVDVLVNT